MCFKSNRAYFWIYYWLKFHDLNAFYALFSPSISAELSALVKLFWSIIIYATWLSSIAYCKNNCVFSFFYATFIFCDYTFSYCMKPSGMCLHIYSLPSFAFLKYQTSGFYCTWSKSHPLLTFKHVHFAKFHFHHSVFPQNTGLGIDILFTKKSYIARSLIKYINTRLAFVYYPNGNEMDQVVRNDIPCNFIPRVRIAFRYAPNFILIAFLRILIAYLHKYAAYLGCWKLFSVKLHNA